MRDVEVLIVGGGIIGLATARALLRAHPSARVVIVEKENAVAVHQSGRNSGVIHAGVYYPPGSDKARLCTAGRVSMVEYCKENGIAHAVCGKLVVATAASELPALAELEHRCAENGVRVERVGPERIREIEPHVEGIAAAHVLDTGIVDYTEVCRSLAKEFEGLGGEVHLGCTVQSGAERGERVVVETSAGPFAATRVVTCAGLHADAVARAISGPAGAGGLRVVAFRGEYRSIVAGREHLVRGLVYPVPDPQYPFLGVHLTRGIDGHVHVGPNAVLAFAREGYSWRRVVARDLGGTIAFAGFRRFALHNMRFGASEMLRSLSRRRFTAAVRRLLPEIGRADLVASPSGVRAQAMTPTGELVDDFAIHTVGRAVHVLNAPSPAATASLEIGATIARHIEL